MELVIIAAVADNDVIGREGTLPWHLPEDLAHFKETTLGHPVIMGRIAYEDIERTIGGPLPGRTNIVLSRGDPELPEEVIVASGPDEAIAAAEGVEDDVAFVAGGASVYEVFLSRADRMILSELEAPFEGDVTFPSYDRDAWRKVSRRDRDGFAIVEYERRTEPRQPTA